MPFIVYCVTNMVNGKAYIGLTHKTARGRWYDHKADAKRSNMRLHIAMREDGFENFSTQVLCESDTNTEDLRKREKAYIQLFGTMNPELGYNTAIGGAGCVGFKMPRDIVDRLANQNRGLKRSSEVREKLRNAKLGTKRSTVSIEKAAAKRRGMKYPAEWRKKMSDSQRHKGKGVYFQSGSGKWHARVMTNEGRKHLGLFTTEPEAIAARDAALAREK